MKSSRGCVKASSRNPSECNLPVSPSKSSSLMKDNRRKRCWPAGCVLRRAPPSKSRTAFFLMQRRVPNFQRKSRTPDKETQNAYSTKYKYTENAAIYSRIAGRQTPEWARNKDWQKIISMRDDDFNERFFRFHTLGALRK